MKTAGAMASTTPEVPLTDRPRSGARLGWRVGLGLAGTLGSVGLLTLLLGGSPAPDKPEAPANPPAATSEQRTTPPSAPAPPSVPAAPTHEAAPDPKPLDCGLRAAPVALVGELVIESALLCEALDTTVGNAADDRRRQGPALLERLIDHALIQRELAARGLSIAADLDAELARLSLTRPSRYERAELGARLAARLLVGEGATPDRGRLEAEYRRAPERWARPGGAMVEGFIVRTRVGASAEALDKAREGARRAFEALSSRRGVPAPHDPAVAAMEPLEPSPLESSGLEPDLEAAVFSAAGLNGDWLGPIHTRVGFVVVRASAVTLPTPRTFEEVEAELRRAETTRLARQHEQDLLGRLRREALIERLVVW